MLFVTDGYKPTLDFATISMRMFAEAGANNIAQRSNRPDAGSVADCLAGIISQKTESRAINYEFSENNLRKGKIGFWPLPEISGNADVFSFFKPKIDVQEGVESLTVHLLLTTTAGDASIGMRFEQGLQNDSDRHHYSHAQFLPELEIPKIGTISLCAPVFGSSPALPVPPIGPFGTWFAALVSVAGHERGGKNGISRAFDEVQPYFSGQDYGVIEVALSAVIGRMLFDH